MASLLPVCDAAPPLRSRVSSALDELQSLHDRVAWTPGRDHVRPTPEDRARKDAKLAAITATYAPDWHYVLHTVFGFPMRVFDGKFTAVDDALAAVAPSAAPRRVLADNEFPYGLPAGTNHSVLWYLLWGCPVGAGDGATGTCSDDDSLPVPEATVTADVEVELRAAIGSEQFEFVWYVNPKMTVPELFHVQVFWRRLPPDTAK